MMTRRRPAGSLLMITLWLVTILSVLAITIARMLSLDIRLAKRRQAMFQAGQLARSGIYLAAQRLMADASEPEAGDADYDWAGDEWAYYPTEDPEPDATRWIIPLAEERGRASPRAIEVRVIDEERKLPLNAATRDQLTALLGDEGSAQLVIDALDSADPAEDRPEDAPPYFAKNGPFERLEELLDLPGLPADRRAVLHESATPYLDAAEAVNLNTAAPEVLAALGITPGTIELILQFREGPDGPEAHEQDGVFAESGLAILSALEDHMGVDLTGTEDGNRLSSSAFGVSSQAFTIIAEGVVGDPPVRARVRAVVRRAGCPGGYTAPCVMAWHEG